MKRKIHTLNGKAWGKIGSVCAVFGVAATVWAASQADYVSAATVQFQLDASSETLEMEIDSSSIVLDLTPSSSGRFGSEDFNITVGTSSQYGYSLRMVTDPTLNGALKRTEALNNGNTPTIAAITSKSGGYTQAEIEASSALTNMWGYKCTTCVIDGTSDSTNYIPVPTTSTVIAKTNTNANANTTTLTFGAKIDNNTPAGVYGTTIVFAAIVNNPGTISSINQVEYMQQFATLTSAEVAAVKASMVQNTQYSLKDSRDQKAYYIAKLADGNIWMTQNLDLDLNSSTTYTPSNTDIPANWTPSTSTYAKGVTTWNYSTTSPESYDPGNLCWNGVLDENWETTLDNGTTACIDGSNMNYSIGNYYNWTAAVAMNDSSSYTTQNQDVNQSICPAGWMLPKSGTTQTGSGSFLYLKNQLSLTSGTSGNIQNTPVFFTYGGDWGGESWDVGSYGYYWSSVVSNESTSYSLYFDVNGYLDPQYEIYRDYGYSVRCVAR